MVFTLKAPLSGILFPIENIPDPVFAQKTLGNGISIDPTSQILVAPCNSEILHIHSSHHALTLRAQNGLEIMVHIGIDTVGLKGVGFKTLVKMGDKVDLGQPLIEFDADKVAQSATSLLTQMIILNGDLVSEYLMHSGKVVAGKDNVIEVKLKTLALRKTSTEKSSQKVTSEKIRIVNPNGLHARPVAVLASAAKSFPCEISLSVGEKSANAKSVVAIMALDIRLNDLVILNANGENSELAVAKLTELLKSGLGETHAEKPKTTLMNPRRAQNLSANQLGGISASPGVAVGNVFQVKHAEIIVVETATDSHAERTKLENAIEHAKQQLNSLQDSLRAQADSAKAAIFSAHEEILSDPDMQANVLSEINKGRSAAFAWKQAYTLHSQSLANLKNELLAARANDIRDVGQRVLHLLVGETAPKKMVPPKNAILIAEDITPSDTAELDPAHVRGFCTIAGGATSHVAILARSLGIPAIAGIDPRALEIANGAPVILDATNGVLKINPTTEEIASIQQRQQRQEVQKSEDLKSSAQAAKTKDGFTVEVAANIGNTKDADRSVTLGADGVGLLRSEFLFLERTIAPTEDEQFDCYQKIARALGKDKPFVVRTLDVGGDKPLPYLPIPKEDNPFLGERGLRVGLNRPEILRTQIRAILRATGSAKTMIMFPMVTAVDEFRAAKAVVLEEAKNLGVDNIPVGIMVEVPSAAILAERFAPHVDFFSIGTNDLTQYTLAIDRGHPKLAALVDGLDPAVLKLIQMTVHAADKFGKWVGVCGGIASEPAAIPILVGLGVHELSVSVPSVPRIKAIVRSLSKKECKILALKALEKESAPEVRALVAPLISEL